MDLTENFEDLEGSVSRAQLERLYFLEFRLFFLGELRRSDLNARFGTGGAAATRDIALYRELAPDNLEFGPGGKIYVLGAGFTPLFRHAPARVLTALAHGFGAGIDTDAAPLIRCDILFALSLPTMDVLAPVTRAIYQKRPVRTTYYSMTSGKTEREIVPLGLAFNGARWHTRAYDRRTKEFRDFVLSRMENPKVLREGNVRREEAAEFDAQWSRIVEIELVPHPNHDRHDVIMREYAMTGRCLRLKMRATNVGYLLRLWNVDCSPDHSLKGPEFTLWLKDSLALYGIETAVLAPGYKPPAGV